MARRMLLVLSPENFSYLFYQNAIPLSIHTLALLECSIRISPNLIDIEIVDLRYGIPTKI